MTGGQGEALATPGPHPTVCWLRGKPADAARAAVTAATATSDFVDIMDLYRSYL